MKVSIIVPVYNGEKTIARCIDSILGQTLDTIELIVIDDGSSDRTGEICTSYRDERLRYYRTVNNGVSSARNQGVSLASGEYVGFVDADDYIAPDMCEKMYQAGVEAGADICVCDYDVVFDTGQVAPYTDLLREGIFDRRQICEEVLPKFLGHIDPEGNIAKFDWAVVRRFFRRDFLSRIDLWFDETLSNSEDCLYSYCATHHADSMVYLKNEKLYINMRNSQSLTRQYLPDYWQQRCRIMDKLEAIIEQTQVVWEMDSFPLFVMRCIRPSFTNIAYGFGKVNPIKSIREFSAIVHDSRVRKMCVVMKIDGLNHEWKKLVDWCRHKRYLTLYLYYMDVEHGNKLCRFIRTIQKAVERKFKCGK